MSKRKSKRKKRGKKNLDTHTLYPGAKMMTTIDNDSRQRMVVVRNETTAKKKKGEKTTGNAKERPSKQGMQCFKHK